MSLRNVCSVRFIYDWSVGKCASAVMNLRKKGIGQFAPIISKKKGTVVMKKVELPYVVHFEMNASLLPLWLLFRLSMCFILNVYKVGSGTLLLDERHFCDSVRLSVRCAVGLIAPGWTGNTVRRRRRKRLHNLQNMMSKEKFDTSVICV